MKRARTSSKTFQGVKNGPFASTFQRLLRTFNKQGVEKTYIFPVSHMGRSNGRPTAGTVVTAHNILCRTRN